MHKNNDPQFKIQERRRQVASMLAQSMTETDMFFSQIVSMVYQKR
jgi:hypothetical protein